MNTNDFLVLYDRVAEAPDAVGRMRSFVLDLAVRGKLVEQDPADEPASELLKRIEVARKLVLASSRRTSNVVIHSSLAEMPFSLPAGWASAQLSQLVRVLNGRAYKKAELLDSGIPVLRVGNLFTSKHWYYSNLQLEDDKYCDEGDLLYAWSASFGPVIWQGPRVIYHSHIWKLSLFTEADLNKRFLYYFLLQHTQEIKSAGHGISMVHIKKGKMEKLAVPLPPLAEQRRIVAKVDELMALCDRLEEARKARGSTRDRFTKATLTRLIASDADVQTFRSHARFTINALPALTACADQVKHLRQVILSLAVRGKLVEQNPTDEPASELLKRIEEEKARQVKVGKIRRRKILAALGKLPFSVPENWRWTRVREIASDRGQKVPDEQFTYIDVSAIDKGNGLVVGPRVLEPGKAPSRARKVARLGDVVYSCVRPYLLNVAVIEDDFDPPPIVSTAFEVLNGHGLVLPRYIWIVLRSPFIVGYVEKNQRGQAYPAIKSADFAVLPFPLPPLAEQRRIVAKVDELMALCDRLEVGLGATEDTRSRLLESLLHDALVSAAYDAATVRRYQA